MNKKLNQFQRLTCLIVAGVMTSIPTAALEILLSLVPIRLFVKQARQEMSYTDDCSPYRS